VSRIPIRDLIPVDRNPPHPQKKAYLTGKPFLNNIFTSNNTITAYLSIGIFHDGRDVLVRISFFKFLMLQ